MKIQTLVITTNTKFVTFDQEDKLRNEDEPTLAAAGECSLNASALLPSKALDLDLDGCPLVRLLMLLIGLTLVTPAPCIDGPTVCETEHHVIQQVNIMLHKDIVETSCSPWA